MSKLKDDDDDDDEDDDDDNTGSGDAPRKAPNELLIEVDTYYK